MKLQIVSLLNNCIDTLKEQSDSRCIVGGITTGFSRLDQLTSGFQKSNLITIAGVACSGKTALALCMARNAAIEGNMRVLIVSLNESSGEAASKMLCSEARVDYSRIRSGFLSTDDWSKLANAEGMLADAPIHISDDYDRAEIRDSDIDLLIIDSFQRLTEGDMRLTTQEHRSYTVANEIKDIARHKDIPVIVTSSLNEWRIDERLNKRPKLSDIKYGYTCLTDLSDVVLLTYRDELYDKSDDNPNRGVLEVNVAKQRTGPVGLDILTFLAAYGRVDNLADDLSLFDVGP